MKTAKIFVTKREVYRVEQQLMNGDWFPSNHICENDTAARIVYKELNKAGIPKAKLRIIHSTIIEKTEILKP